MRLRPVRPRVGPRAFPLAPTLTSVPLLALVLAAVLVSSPGQSRAQGDFAPSWHPSLTLHRAAGAITVDGDLDDPGWQGAAVADGFCENSPGDNVAPLSATRVLATYDSDNFYLAFIADDDPALVRAGLRDRDAIWQDDYIGIILDTYAEQSWAYEFFVNPLGVQGDLRLVDGGGEDMGFDLVWSSEGKITADGWQVEVAIPFASLRFPDRPGGEQVWRAVFWRDRKRDFRRRDSWAAMDRDEPCWMCNFGTLRGIEGVEPGGGLSLLPSMIAHQGSHLADRDDPDSPWTAGDFRADFGLGIAYSFGPNLALEGTLNPDFSQVESDAAQIDVNTPFALFYEERRPFFQRGSNLFQSWVNAIYTRSINDPYVAAKFTARRGRVDLLYMTAEDEHSPWILPFEESSRILLGGESLSNIVRVRRGFDGGSFLGGMLTDRRHGTSFDKHGLLVPSGGGAGTVGGLDWRLRFLDNWSWEFQGLLSHTEEPEDSALTADLADENLRFDDDKHSAAFDGENYSGHAAYCSFERDGRHWGFDMDLRTTSPSFRAENGFITSNNRREISTWTGWQFRPAGRWVDSVHPQTIAGGAWNYDSKQKDKWFYLMLDLSMIKQTSLHIEQLWSGENYRGVQFDGIRRSTANLSCNPTNAIQFGGEVDYAHTIRRTADPFLGKLLQLEGWATVRLGQHTVVQPSVTWVRMKHPDTDEEVFRGYVARTRLGLQFTRRLFLRTIFQYDDFDAAFDVEPLLSYKLNPFTVLYVGSTHHLRDFPGDGNLRQVDRQFFLKVQALIKA